MQSAPARVVAPTPPAGVKAVSAAVVMGPAPAAVIRQPAAPPVSNEIVCSRCLTRNPAEGKFCVSCGAPLSAPEPPPPSPNDEQPTRPSPIPAAGVVHIAPEPEPKPELITCDRCQGVCDSGMRFCKFCGAPLPTAPEKRDPVPSLSAERYAEIKDRNEEPPPPTQRGLASDYGSPSSPRPRVSQPQAPESIGSTERSRTRPASTRSPTETRDEVLTGEPTVGTKTGQFVPFSGSSSLPAGRLVVVGGDGQEGSSFPLVGDQVDIGRSEGSVVLADDKYMSPRHARLMRVDGAWHLRDLESTNGVFFRIRDPHVLVDGDVLLLGVEVLRFELVMDAELGLGPAVQHGTLVFGSPALPRPARLVQRTVEGVARDVYHLHRLETVIGRESGDIVFTDDPYMSRRHATIRRSTSSGAMTLVDLNSSNGTFVAIRGDCVLKDGDSIRVGQHLFRMELAPG